MTAGTHVDADVIVVGGGPAGLSAALCLARYDRTVLLLDAGDGRSSHQQVNRNYLGFPGGVKARALRDLGLRQLADYPQVRVEQAQAERAAREDGVVTVAHADGSCSARAVILCNGVRDDYPRFVDCARQLGRWVFWCPSCDGYECRDRQVVVTGDDDESALEALLLARFTPHVTLVTDTPAPRISDRVRDLLKGADVTVIEEGIRTLEERDGGPESLVTVTGTAIPVERLFVKQHTTPRTELAAMLGVELDASGYVRVDVDQHTSVPGVFAAGDLTRPHSHQISAAVHEGAQAAAAAHHHLYTAEFGLG
jgi:thioredoxin reductase (NADPH)